MFSEKQLSLLAQILLIAGALNWGLNAYNGMDLVKMASMENPMVELGLKYAVALAGLYAAYKLYA